MASPPDFTAALRSLSSGRGVRGGGFFGAFHQGQQAAQQRRLQALEEQRQEQQRTQQAADMVFRVLESSGGKLDGQKAISAVESLTGVKVPTAILPLADAVAKSQKEQIKAREQQQFTTTELPRASSTVASANLDPSNPSLQSALVALNERFTPEQLQQIEADAAGRSGAVREEREFARNEQLAQERRIERRAIRQERRGEARADLDRAIEATSNVIAQSNTGLLPPTAISEQLQALQGRFSPEQISQITAQARVEAQSVLGETRRRLRSRAEGTAQDVQAFEDFRETLRRDLVGTPERPGLLTQEEFESIPQSEVRELARGNRIIDPVAEHFGQFSTIRVPGGASKTAKVIENRQAQVGLLLAFEDATTAFQDLRQAVEEGRAPGVGPGVPTTVENVMTFLGSGSPEAEAYRNASFEFVSMLLKARQGSRPSDFDMKMYMALLPTLQEATSATGDAKLNQMRQSLANSLAATANPRMRRQILETKRRSLNAQGRRVVNRWESTLNRLDKDRDGNIDPGAELTDRDLAELFGPDLQIWHNSGNADQFILPGVEPVQRPALTPDAQDAINRALREAQ